MTGRRVGRPPTATERTPATAAAASSDKDKEHEKTAPESPSKGMDKGTPIRKSTRMATPKASDDPYVYTTKEKGSSKGSPVAAVKEREPPKLKSQKEEDEAIKQRKPLRSTPRVLSGPQTLTDETGTAGESTSPAAKRVKLSTEPEDEQEQEITTVTVVHMPAEEASGQEQEGGAITQMVQLEDTQITQVQMETGDIVDDSQIFEAVAKMNAEAAAASSIQVQHVVHVQDQQQRSAVDSILSDNGTIPVGTIIQNADGTEIGRVREYVHEDTEEHITTVVEVNPPWNEQGCIICNVDIAIDDPTNQAPKSEQLKDFFLEFFSVGDQISLEDENAFPFCAACAEEMDKLLTVSQNIESMHKQFNKVRDSMAKKAIKTFLSRTKPNCLEEDAKAENYGFLDEEQKKSYKDSMFQLWKSRYELVQPGPKTPIMIRSMDSRGRVTVVRLNQHGQAVPDKFGGGGTRGIVRTDTPLGGMGRLLTNGGDDDEDSGGGNGMGGGTLEIFQCKECTKAFSTKSLLAYHSRVHTGELPYECDVCGKAFSVPHYLLTHMKSHAGEKPYKCLECGKGFAQRGGLVTHSLVHTGAKPFSCQICGKSFRQKYHLTQHNLIHSGVKPFSCELCGKAFNVKMNLREHMRRHTGDRPYKCPYCTTVGFFRKKMLKEHIIKAHPQRTMPEELMAPEPSTSFATHEEEEEEVEEDMEDFEEGEGVPEDVKDVLAQ